MKGLPGLPGLPGVTGEKGASVSAIVFLFDFYWVAVWQSQSENG